MFQVADGGVVLAEGASMPGGFHLKRFDSTGPRYLHTHGFPSFSYMRSIDGNQVIVPLWFVALLAFTTAFCVWRLPMKKPKPGFEVIGTAEPDRLMNVEQAAALPAARRRRQS